MNPHPTQTQPMDSELIRALQAAREAEKEQALYYRHLAAEAERRDNPPLAERYNDLHADEQHHLSRLTARLLELGASPADLDHVRAQLSGMDAWEPAARLREEAEVMRYREIEEMPGIDDATRALVREIRETEERHAEHLGGKWTQA